MPVPTAYTEDSLKTYMDGIAGAVADVLAWSVDGGAYDEAFAETLLVFGQTDISEISGAADIRKLRAIARREVWRQAVRSFATYTDFSSPDGMRSTDSQYQAQAETALKQAESDCLALGIDEYEMVVEPVHNVNDPYVYLPDTLRHLR